MKLIDIKALDQWEAIGSGETLTFESEGRRRNVRLLVNATGRANVFASEFEDFTGEVLVGSSDGLFEIAYTAEGTSYLRIYSEAGDAVYVCGLARGQVVPPVSEEVYTTVEPRARRNSEFDRMMYVMRINERRREEAVKDEIARLRAAGADRFDREGNPVRDITEEVPDAETVDGNESTSGDSAEDVSGGGG